MAIGSLGLAFLAGLLSVLSPCVLPLLPIVLGAAANCDMIQSFNFSILTGTGKWLVSDGVPYAFGIEGMTLNGAGQTTAGWRGIAFFGKNWSAFSASVAVLPLTSSVTRRTLRGDWL